MSKMCALIDSFLTKSSASKKELEKLTGLLAHCATIIRGGRAFCRNLYNSISGGLIVEKLFNGKSTIAKPDLSFKPTSDASQKGFGAVFMNDWFAVSWTESM